MSLHSEIDYEFEDGSSFSDFSKEENAERASHKRQVRLLLEEKLERKRLMEELDELDGEFDWDNLDR